MITLFCFTGILLVVQPEFIFGSSKEDTQNSNQIYYMMVLAAAFLSSFSAIFTHDLSGKVDELVTLQFGYMSQSFCNLLFFMIFIGTSD
jgi:drug/metabolite transporter (DMT)-like permease